MDGRGPTRCILALFVAVVAIVGPAVTTAAAGDAPPTTERTDKTPTETPSTTSDETAPDRPVTTVSEFYPVDNNLSDCVGLVERPGCGSEARGGWRQNAVFATLVVGLGLIIWRISVGVRRNRNTPPTDNRTPGPDESRVT